MTMGLSPLIAVPALAQVQTLNEVIVTARKRPELFRTLPMTASVFTPQTIKSADITSARDFIAMVPNMTLVQTQNVGNAFVTIRGISQARDSEPSVAVSVAGGEEPAPEAVAIP